MINDAIRMKIKAVCVCLIGTVREFKCVMTTNQVFIQSCLKNHKNTQNGSRFKESFVFVCRHSLLCYWHSCSCKNEYFIKQTERVLQMLLLNEEKLFSGYSYQKMCISNACQIHQYIETTDTKMSTKKCMFMSVQTGTSRIITMGFRAFQTNNML